MNDAIFFSITFFIGSVAGTVINYQDASWGLFGMFMVSSLIFGLFSWVSVYHLVKGVKS